jgi:hypothetical protein
MRIRKNKRRKRKMINPGDQERYEVETYAYRRWEAANKAKGLVKCFNCGLVDNLSEARQWFVFVLVFNSNNKKGELEQLFAYCKHCFLAIQESVLHNGTLFGYRYSHVRQEEEEE